MKRWLKIVLIVLAVIALLAVGFVIGSAVFGHVGYTHMPGMERGLPTLRSWERGDLVLFRVGGGIAVALFWAAVIAGIVLLVSSLMRRSASKPVAPAEPTALDVLNRRYAGGEIDQDEHERIKRTLSL